MSDLTFGDMVDFELRLIGLLKKDGCQVWIEPDNEYIQVYDDNDLYLYKFNVSFESGNTPKIIIFYENSDRKTTYELFKKNPYKPWGITKAAEDTLAQFNK